MNRILILQNKLVIALEPIIITSSTKKTQKHFYFICSSALDFFKALHLEPYICINFIRQNIKAVGNEKLKKQPTLHFWKLKDATTHKSFKMLAS